MPIIGIVENSKLVDNFRNGRMEGWNAEEWAVPNLPCFHYSILPSKEIFKFGRLKNLYGKHAS